MKRFIAIGLVLALGGCSDTQVQTAGTVVAQSVELLYGQAQILGLLLVAQGKISQAQYDQWNADAQLAVTSTKLGTTTTQQLQTILNELKSPPKTQ